jgi:hypothetical protein
MKLRKIKTHKQKKSKKGLSLIVEYVLLITLSVALSIIVYKLLKTYVPQGDLNCPDGTSLLIEDYSYDCNSKILTLNMLNNGKFDIGGYFIYGTNSSVKENGDIELSSLNMEQVSRVGPLGVKFGSFYDDKKNSLGPNERETEYYNLTKISGQLHLVQITPLRWQTQDRDMKIISCKDAVIKKGIDCT